MTKERTCLYYPQQLKVRSHFFKVIKQNLPTTAPPSLGMMYDFENFVQPQSILAHSKYHNAHIQQHTSKLQS